MRQGYVELEMRIHELEQTNASIYEELKLKDNEIEKLIISTPTSPPTEEEQVNNNIDNNNNMDVYG